MTEQVACLNVAIPCPHVLQQDEGSLLSLLRPRGEAYEKNPFTCSTTLSLLGRIDHRNLRGQLQVDQKVDATVDLIPQRSLLRRNHLLKRRNILHT